MNERPGYGDADAKRIIERAAEQDHQEHESTAPTRVSWLKRHPAIVTIAVIVAALVFIALTRVNVAVPPHL